VTGARKSLLCLRCILSRVGYVTRLITSRCQGCSEYLLCFAFTIIQSIIQLLLSSYNPVFQLLFNYVCRRICSTVSGRGWISTDCSSSTLGFYNLGHCYAMDLLFIRRFEQFVPFRLLGNAFVAPGNGPLLLRCLWERSMYSL
jgi:hypothetical protein